MRPLERRVHNSCTYKCEICGLGPNYSTHLHTFQRVMPLYESILCPKGPFDKHFKLDCLLGKCGECGVHKLKVCPHKVSGNGQIMHWTCFQKVVVGQNKQGEEKKVTHLESFCIESSNFLAYLTAKMKSFIIHNFIKY